MNRNLRLPPTNVTWGFYAICVQGSLSSAERVNIGKTENGSGSAAERKRERGVRWEEGKGGAFGTSFLSFPFPAFLVRFAFLPLPSLCAFFAKRAVKAPLFAPRSRRHE